MQKELYITTNLEASEDRRASFNNVPEQSDTINSTKCYSVLYVPMSRAKEMV